MNCFLVILSCFAFVVAGRVAEDSGDCIRYLQKVLSHNNLELIGTNEDTFIFTWSHIDSLLSDKKCVTFYLLQSTPKTYERHKRESVSSTTQISSPLSVDSTSGSLTLVASHCSVYDIQLAVATSDHELLVSLPLRIWPIIHVLDDNRLQLKSTEVKIELPAQCRHETNDWTLSLHNQKQQVADINEFFGLDPCESYKVEIFDSEDASVWSSFIQTPASDLKLNVIPAYTRMLVSISPDSVCKTEDTEVVTEVTYCSIYEGGSGDEYYDDEENMEACVTKQVKNEQIKLTSLRPCTLYSLNVKSIDMKAQKAAETVLEEHGSVHSTLCQPEESQQSSTESSPFWFETTSSEKNVEEAASTPDIHKIHKTEAERDLLPLDITIGISLGLSSIFMLFIVMLIALYMYGQRKSPKFASISTIDVCNEDNDYGDDRYDVAMDKEKKILTEYLIH